MNLDDDILALLGDVENLNVHDGSVDVDEEAKVVRVALPYVVYWSSPGFDNDERFSGQVVGRVTDFQLTGVGEDRNQAKWVLDKARAALSRKRVNGRLIRRDDDNQMVRRDDDLTRPGGEPLFYGVDRYSVGSS